IFATAAGQSNTQTVNGNVDLLAALPTLPGQTVRLRITGVNNRGKLIVGIDNVAVQATFADLTAPTFVTPPALRNPGCQAGTPLLDTTTDATIVGRVADNGSPNNVAYVEYDLNNDDANVRGGITATSGDTVSPIVVTSNNKLKNGDRVTITGVT